MDLKQFIREIPDFPKKGINFKDITPLLADAKAFAYAMDSLTDSYISKKVDYVVCIEARGFVVGAPLAYRLGAGVIMVRKPGKLPYECFIAPSLERSGPTLPPLRFMAWHAKQSMPFLLEWMSSLPSCAADNFTGAVRA